MDETQKALAWAIGTEIRRLRLVAGMTQEDLADTADMTANYVSLVELGQTNITIAAATRIAHALHEKLSHILITVNE